MIVFLYKNDEGSLFLSHEKPIIMRTDKDDPSPLICAPGTTPYHCILEHDREHFEKNFPLNPFEYQELIISRKGKVRSDL